MSDAVEYGVHGYRATFVDAPLLAADVPGLALLEPFV